MGSGRVSVSCVANILFWYLLNIKLSKDGTVQEAKVASGSGSDQIDKIVLQSVKDTLNVVKPPSSEIKTPDFNLSLIIYF